MQDRTPGQLTSARLERVLGMKGHFNDKRGMEDEEQSDVLVTPLSLALVIKLLVTESPKIS